MDEGRGRGCCDGGSRAEHSLIFQLGSGQRRSRDSATSTLASDKRLSVGACHDDDRSNNRNSDLDTSHHSQAHNDFHLSAKMNELVAWAIFIGYFAIIFASFGFVFASILSQKSPKALLGGRPFTFVRVAIGALICTWLCK